MEYYIGNLNDGYNFYAKEFFSVLLLTDKRRNQNWIISTTTKSKAQKKKT